MYPAVMLAMAVSVTIFLVAWVLPRFAKIYEARSATLPTPTRVLMSISEAITTHWSLMLFGLITLIVGLVFGARTERGRYALDWIKLNAPVVGPIFRNFYLSRAMRTFGTLLASGVDVLDAISIVRGVTNNALWERFWADLEREITNGQPLADVILESSLIPPATGQMIAAGDRSGRLPDVLERVAGVCEEDLDEAIRTSTQMIEPLVITFMGVMIGGIAIALLLPIFTMGSVVSK
jgi:type IV pilus assembly protein PilC